jgi:integrase
MTDKNLLLTEDRGKSTDLWSTDLFRLHVDLATQITGLRELLRTCSSDLGHYLADVKSDSPFGGFTKDDIRAVEKEIVDHCKKEKDKARILLRILKQIVSQLNRHFQKCIPSPTLLDRMRADPNLLTKEFPVAQRSVGIWIDAERDWLAQTSGRDDNSNSEPIAWEMVVAFAALHSGGLSVGFAAALADALADPHRYFACSKYRAYGDFQIQGKVGYPLTRWYPDDRLLLLMSRVEPKDVRNALEHCSRPNATQKERRRCIAKTIMEGINRELRRFKVHPAFQPRSLGNFLVTISLFLRSELPSTLVDFATGKLPSRPMLPFTIGRINGDPVAEATRLLDNAAVEFDREEPDFPRAYEATGNPEKDPRWMKQLRVAFSCGEPAQVCIIIEALLTSQEITPGGLQLCTLALKLLRGCASTGNQWQFSSVRCCVLTTARRFILGRRSEDPATYKPETLENLYLEVLNDAAEDSETPARLQRAVAWALREYQRHLVTRYKASPVDEALAFHVAAGPFPVDARVISLDDLFRAIEYIKTAPQSNWTELYRCVALGHLVLVFLGGLRRMEALGLAPKDALPSSFFNIFVRENEFRGLKTPNADRSISLATFAYPFNDLLDYVWDLYDVAKAHGEDFSCGISDDVIIPIIHQALQNVTGDLGCHLHNLRHSAGHWMLLRLALSDFDHVPNLFPHLPLTMRWLDASKMFRKLFYHNDSSSNDHAWAVAVTLGHSNPSKVSLRYYVHCLDLWLSLALQFNSSVGGPVDDEQLRKLSGLRRSTAYKHLPSLKHEDPVQHKKRQAEFARDLFRKRYALPLLLIKDLKLSA